MTYTNAHEGHRTRIFLSGGSGTVTRPVSHLPMMGWGQALDLFLTDEVEVVNCSRGRASTKSFRERGRLQWILDTMAPGDYLIMAFGQIDWKPDPGIHTEPFEDFIEHLRAYVTGARERQAHPILMMPFERRRIDRHGNVSRFLGDYPVAMRQLAQEEFVPLIDVYGQSLQWWEELGPEETKRVFTYLRPGEPLMPVVQDADNVHLRADGAVEVARFVARALVTQQLVPTHWVKDLDRRTFSYEEMGWLDEATFQHRTKSRVTPARDL